MFTQFPRLVVLALFAAWFVAVPRVWAEMIEWSYEGSATSSPNSGLQFLNAAGPIHGSGTTGYFMSVSIPLQNYFWGPGGGSTAYSSNFVLSARLTDTASGQSGTITFKGNVNGTIGYVRTDNAS
jgi:hypothetical protein